MFQKMSIVGGFSAGKCCDMKEHVKSLVELFDFAVSELNNNSKEVQDRCLKIGEAHLGACGGSASQVWDDLGDCLTDAIAKTEAVRGKREALKAWITLISFLVDSMKAGYTAQCKRRSIIRPSGTVDNDSPLPSSPMSSMPMNRHF
uniref:Uncharacterized protein n=1 Tax=Acrobeloides nanus TaxID=290746 RepID=A0A914CYP2_9BILA